MLKLLRRLRDFGSNLLLIPTMWRYLVRAAQIDQRIAEGLRETGERSS